MIQSADSLLFIRDMRNQISHEYLPEALMELVAEVIDLYPQLLKNINRTKSFLKKRGWNKEI